MFPKTKYERGNPFMTEANPDRQWRVTVTSYYPARTERRLPPKQYPKSEYNPPRHEIQSFARCILPAIQAYFETDRGKKEYAEWCEKRQAQSSKTA